MCCSTSGGHRNVNDAGYAYETEGNRFIVNTTLWKNLADSLDVKFRITEGAGTDFIAAAVTDDQVMTTTRGEGDNTARLRAGTNAYQIHVSSQVDDSEAACSYIEVLLLPSDDYMPGINTLAYVQIRDQDGNKVRRGGC